MLTRHGSSSPDAGAQAQENQLVADFEDMLSNRSAEHGENRLTSGFVGGGWSRRLWAIVILAGFGAALALVPMGMKSEMMTGRSVAHSQQDR